MMKTIGIKNVLTFKWYFFLYDYGTEQTPFKRVSLSDTHFTVKSTEAMWIKCLAQGHNILIQPGFDCRLLKLETDIYPRDQYAPM